MRIVLDLQACQSESRFRGIGRYSMDLAKGMTRNAGDHEIWLVLNNLFPETIKPIRDAFSRLIPQEHIVVFAVPGPVAEQDPANAWRSRAAEQVRESFLASIQPDMVHVASLFEGWVDDAVTSVGLPGQEFDSSVTLYDLIPLLNSEIYLPNQALKDYYYRKLQSLKNAQILLSISEHAREEGIAALNVPNHRIVNISAAVDERFQPHSNTSEIEQTIKAHYGLSRPFIMYAPGGFDPRKNIEGLIKAFGQLPAQLRTQHQLAIVSKIPDGEHRRFIQLISRLGLAKDEVIFTDYISDDDLVLLYNLCELFVFPSLHEGFGLPALEAMACGAPVIGSNTTSIPEVIGRKDALFDPTNPEAISQAMYRALTDDAFQKSLRENARIQAAKFSWDESAKRALEAFEDFKARSQHQQSSKTWKYTANDQQYQKLLGSLGNLKSTTPSFSDSDLIVTAGNIALNEVTTANALRACELNEQITWRIEGPFDSTYSLALLNRETARALVALGHNVSLHSTEGPGDFLPNSDYLKKNQDLAALYGASKQMPPESVEVMSRNLYPPRVLDMSARINLLHHYAWEESGFPQEWVDNFNQALQGITCLSQHVEKILIDNGVTTPLETSGCGVDHWERITADTEFELKARRFKFLHVSSCFPRKAVDVLLDAYGMSFSDTDDVTLVIKTFPNPHNEVHQWLAELKHVNKNFPHVLIIEEDLSNSKLKALYQRCHALVAPSRAEGFGLPMAEAMLSGLPVITTNWGGQLDFCNRDTAWLVDYHFQRAKTHFNLFDSVWAEPDVQDLARVMHEVYNLPSGETNQRVDAGRRLLLDNFSWAHVADRLVSSARKWSKVPTEPNPRIGWVTTWNVRCGISEYSAHLIDKMPSHVTVLAATTNELTQPDQANVLRCWDADGIDNLRSLEESIESLDLDTVVIQFNYGFFEFHHLAKFIAKQIEAGRIVMVTLHSTKDPLPSPHKKLAILREVFSRCHRVFVHSVHDLNVLKAMGLIDNVALFPHGIIDHAPSLTENIVKAGPRIIASYGFFLPHKGLIELIEAVALMVKSGENIRLIMVNAEYPDPVSDGIIRQARSYVKSLGISNRVELITDYLSDEESLKYLSRADLIVFPYQDTGESSSAAVRYGIATGRPVAVTPLDIFEDVSSAVLRLPGTTPEMIAQGIKQYLQDIMNDSENVKHLSEGAQSWRESHVYSHLSKRLYGITVALHVRSLIINEVSGADC
jgi:glycosyltransferase involved in cell wall biosynthesis